MDVANGIQDNTYIVLSETLCYLLDRKRKYFPAVIRLIRKVSSHRLNPNKEIVCKMRKNLFSDQITVSESV